jgi:uncharacterized membrane protein (DUF485 family)
MRGEACRCPARALLSECSDALFLCPRYKLAYDSGKQINFARFLTIPAGGYLMVGLMQIMIYMLAVYLVFKGLEIFQVALMSSRSNRTVGLLLGVGCIVLAIIAGVGFSYWADTVASSISDRMNAIPSLR